MQKTMLKRIRGAIKAALPDAVVMFLYRILYFLKTGHAFKSGGYWEERYAGGDTSGSGSYGKLAQYKADFLNQFAAEKHIESVIEFGSGDGNQASLFNFNQYTGFDVSPTAVAKCREKFRDDPTKQFFQIEEYKGEQAELVLSLDVIYHLIEDDVYEDYMRRLFQAGTRYVIVYSSNDEAAGRNIEHVRHRKFTDWVANNTTEWIMERCIKNLYPYDRQHPDETSLADFYLFKHNK